jgi:surface polysaccharide O-acyltransferase-like enzyme
MYFLDILRVTATLAVILLHTVSGIKDTTDMSVYPDELKVFLIITDFVSWCVPVFILISGFLFLNPERTFSYKNILFKYCRRIVLALLIFGIPYACVELAVNEQTFDLNMLPQAFIMVCRGQSWSHMWYLYLIIILYLITPPLKLLLKKVPHICIYFLLAAIFAGVSIFPFVNLLRGNEALPVLPTDTIYIFYYICGYLFSAHKVKKEECPDGKNITYMRIVLIVATAATSVCMLAVRLAVSDRLQLPYNYPFTVLLSLLIFLTASAAYSSPKPSISSTVSSLSKLCFTIYLIHPIFINLAYKFMHLSLLDYPLILSVPAFYIVFTVLSVAVAWLLYKIPFMKKYVL